MWASLYEKAWVKILGGYANIEAGSQQSAMRAILGSPVMTYRSSESIFDEVTALKAWNIFKSG